MKLTDLRKELDSINSHPITQEITNRIWQLEDLWSHYNSKNLGDFRAIIEDRLHLAHSRRVRAGF